MPNIPVEIITADTGPLIHLASLGLLSLLEKSAPSVVVPDLVLMEATVEGKPYAKEINDWFATGLALGKIRLVRTSTGESVELARLVSPSYRQKDGGERAILDWLIDEVDKTDVHAMVLYENGTVPAMISRWNSDLNGTMLTTKAFLSFCQEMHLLADARVVWQKLEDENPSINKADQRTRIRR